MEKVVAMDCRKNAPSDAPGIEVEYDPDKIQQFDTRGKCGMKLQETWGQKVEVEVNGERCVLYLEQFSRTFHHINRFSNFIKEG